MVDDVGRHDPNAHILRMVARLAFNFDVEGEDGGVLRMSLLVHDGNLRHIALVHRSDSDRADRDGRLRFFAQELQQGLQRSQRGCLDQNALLVRAQLVFELCEVGHDFDLDVFLFVVRSHNQDRRSGHDLFETVSDNLYSQRSLDLLVMDVLRFDTHFAAWGWRQQAADLGDDGTIQRTEHGLVALAQVPVHDENVHGHTETVDRLHLQHRALQIGAPHELLPDLSLCHLTQQEQDVLHTFSGNRGCRHERDEIGIHPIIVSHLPVQVGIDSLLLELNLGIKRTAAEFADRSFLLLFQRFPDGRVLASLPSVTSIHLVQGHHERHTLLHEHVQTFDRLLLQSVHEIDHEDGNIAQGGSAGSQVGEGLVTWRVNNEHSRNLHIELLDFVQASSLGFQRLLLEEGRSDLLRDTAGLPLLNVRLSDFVQQLRLSRIDVAHDNDDGTAQVVAGASGKVGPFLRFSLLTTLLTFLLRQELLHVLLLLFRSQLGALFGFDAFLLGAFQSELTQSFLLLLLGDLGQIDVLFFFLLHFDSLQTLVQFGKSVIVVAIGVPLIAVGICHGLPVVTAVVVVLFLFGGLVFILLFLWLGVIGFWFIGRSVFFGWLFSRVLLLFLFFLLLLLLISFTLAFPSLAFSVHHLCLLGSLFASNRQHARGAHGLQTLFGQSCFGLLRLRHVSTFTFLAFDLFLLLLTFAFPLLFLAAFFLGLLAFDFFDALAFGLLCRTDACLLFLLESESFLYQASSCGDLFIGLAFATTAAATFLLLLFLLVLISTTAFIVVINIESLCC
mmetsp:Transcript_1144/g.2702  ORF Transcript_1144/g.2702 Transcript_1144/m.2702 type:complete len:785 (+) Transcript_1144:521-2875(+)